MMKIFQNIYTCDLTWVNVMDELRWCLDRVKVAITLTIKPRTRVWWTKARSRIQWAASLMHPSFILRMHSNSRASGQCLLRGILKQKLAILQQREFLIVPELPKAAFHSLCRILFYCRLCCCWPGHSLPRGKNKQDAISLSNTISS